MPRSVALAVLVSGEGRTLDGLAEMISGGHLPAHIALVVADRPHARAIEKARHRGLPTVVRPFHGTDPERWSVDIGGELERRGVELVVLAGFLTILPPEFLRAWAGRVINVHPSLLPRFGGRGMYGRHVLDAVLGSGDRETGATVHVVTEAVDAGPTLHQERVPVLPGDTAESLRERLHPAELRAIAEVVRRVADGQLSLPLPHSEEAPVPRRGDERPP